MRSIVLGGIGIVFVGLASLYTARQVAAGRSEIVKAFTATVKETKFRPDGGGRREETYTVAFRGDGSSVVDHHHTLPNGQTVEVKMVEDMNSGRKVAVDYATESTSTYPLPSDYAATVARRASACTSVKDSGGSTILGYEVVLVHEGRTFANGAANVHERWEAPALNCFALRTIDSPPERSGVAKVPHNETEIVKVALGEPDPALFSIPKDFVERSPSERHAEFERRFGLRAPTPPDADKVYDSGRERLK
ncbi:MAG: hypothetical protein ABR881_31060 [Candidatus Sulfotelmatobacter sp.]|jgi:hypothetical protein